AGPGARRLEVRGAGPPERAVRRDRGQRRHLDARGRRHRAGERTSLSGARHARAPRGQRVPGGRDPRTMSAWKRTDRRTRRGPRAGAALAAAGLVALAGAAPLAAQAAAGGGVRLTLDEAVSLAERNNPAYRRATNSL